VYTFAIIGSETSSLLLLVLLFGTEQSAGLGARRDLIFGRVNDHGLFHRLSPTLIKDH
jgi:hypothetical protein